MINDDRFPSMEKKKKGKKKRRGKKEEEEEKRRDRGLSDFVGCCCIKNDCCFAKRDRDRMS